MGNKTQTEKKRSTSSFFSTLSLAKEGSWLARHSIHFHNVSQLTATLNDNLFKFLTIFLLISLYGSSESNIVVAQVGAVYVLPFLLFSSTAGVIADRISKQKMMVILKFAEVLLTLFGIFAFYVHSSLSCYTLVFFLSFQSALMGPPKYSIISELVPKDEVSKANGLITAFTYIAAVLGVFIGGMMSAYSNGDYTLPASLCFWIALIGFIASLCVKPTPPVKAAKKASLNFPKEVYQTLRYGRTVPFLLVSIFGSTFFLFVAAFIQMNMIPYAMEVLKESKEVGSNIFVAAAVGISVGGILAGKSSKKEAEIGLSAIAGLFSSLILLAIPLFPTVTTSIIFLFFLGLTGGLYIVPFDAYYQTHTADDKRGQIVATVNFLSFFGVLVAAGLIALFKNPSHGFIFLSLLTFIFFFYVLTRLSARSMNYFLRHLLGRFYKVDLQNQLQEVDKRKIFLFAPRSWLDLALLSSYSSKIHYYFIKEKKGFLDYLVNLFANVHIYTSKQSLDKFQIAIMKEERVPFLIFASRKSMQDFNESLFFRRLASNFHILPEMLKVSYKKREKRRYDVLFSPAVKYSSST